MPAASLAKLERLAAWFTVSVLVAALVPSFFSWPEKRIAPVPFLTSELLQFHRSRTELDPSLQRIIVAAEAGTLLGSPAANYQSELDHASAVVAGDRFTKYTFYEYPEFGLSERNAELTLVVQNKFGHIIRCIVDSPEY